jgi:hypothetical protein
MIYKYSGSNLVNLDGHRHDHTMTHIYVRTNEDHTNPGLIYGKSLSDTNYNIDDILYRAENGIIAHGPTIGVDNYSDDNVWGEWFECNYLHSTPADTGLPNTAPYPLFLYCQSFAHGYQTGDGLNIGTRVTINHSADMIAKFPSVNKIKIYCYARCATNAPIGICSLQYWDGTNYKVFDYAQSGHTPIEHLYTDSPYFVDIGSWKSNMVLSLSVQTLVTYAETAVKVRLYRIDYCDGDTVKFTIDFCDLGCFTSEHYAWGGDSYWYVQIM